MKEQILSVKVKREVDTDPDLSWLGEYGSVMKHDWSIDRQERGDMGRNEFRFFNPAMSGEETGNPKSPEQDYQRMESYNRGDWCMLYVVAVAEVLLTNGVIQKIHSGGLGGIESNSNESCFEEIEQGELSNLRAQLQAIGFTKRQIDKAFKEPEKVEA